MNLRILGNLAVVFLIGGAGGVAQEKEASAKGMSELKLFRETIMNGCRFEDTPFDEALDQLREQLRKVSGQAVKIERIDASQFDFLKDSWSVDEIGEIPITLQLSPTSAMDTFDYTVSLAKHRLVAWNESVFIVPEGATPMELMVFPLSEDAERWLAPFVPAMSPLNYSQMDQPGVEGYVAAVHAPWKANRAFARLAEGLGDAPGGLGFGEAPEPLVRFDPKSFAVIAKDWIQGQSYLVAYHRVEELSALQGHLDLKFPRETERSRRETHRETRRKLLEELGEAGSAAEQTKRLLEFAGRPEAAHLPEEFRLLESLASAVTFLEKRPLASDPGDPEAAKARLAALRSAMEKSSEKLVESLKWEQEVEALIPTEALDPFR